MSTYITSRSEPRPAARGRAAQSLGRLIALACVVACGGRAPVAGPATNSAKTSFQSAPAASNTCAAVGPIACDAPPVAEGAREVCAQIDRCLRGRGEADDPSSILTSVGACSMPFQVTDAPAGHDIDAVELVTLNGDLGGETAEGVYLFARQARGHCLVDRVLDMEWIHFGHFENEIDVHWEGTRLHIVAQRLKRIPLDQSVEYEPSADIDGVWCTYLIYELNAGALRRIAARTEAEACAAAGLSTGSQAQN